MLAASNSSAVYSVDIFQMHRVKCLALSHLKVAL